MPPLGVASLHPRVRRCHSSPSPLFSARSFRRLISCAARPSSSIISRLPLTVPVMIARPWLVLVNQCRICCSLASSFWYCFHATAGRFAPMGPAGWMGMTLIPMVWACSAVVRIGFSTLLLFPFLHVLFGLFLCPSRYLQAACPAGSGRANVVVTGC